MEDKTLLNETFNLYYNKAKAEHADGNVGIAKRNYLLAAETLMRMAKSSTAELKKAQFDRAKRIMDIAENMEAPKKTKSVTGEKGASKGADSDEEGKAFISAEIPDISFADIAGLEDVKRAIRMRMLDPIKHPEKYEYYGKKTGGGVLLFGPPGTGKTMIAKAIAHEAGAKFYAIKGSDIVSKWVGDSEKNINSLFEQARKDDRAIIFVDEMDSLFGARGNDPHNDRRVNEFLQQIDGFAGKSPNMLLLGATNRPWDVDSAAVRSGRFSQKIYIPLPDAEARRYLFKLYLKKAPLTDDVNIAELVKFTENFSGADIAEVCDRAKEAPLEKYIATGEPVKVRQIDLLRVIAEILPTVDRAEIARFERYAGIKLQMTNDKLQMTNEDGNNGQWTTDNGQLKDKDNSPTTNPQPPAAVLLDNPVINLLPGVKPRIEFSLGKSFDKVYLVFDTQHYTCAKKLNNYISDELDISGAGEYDVQVLSGNDKIAEFKITAVKGMAENKLDL